MGKQSDCFTTDMQHTMEETHAVYNGKTKMKNLPCQFTWWPKMDQHRSKEVKL